MSRIRQRQRWPALSAIILVLLPPGTRSAPDLPVDVPSVPGTVIRVVDGDTVDVRLQNQKIRVRLHGADAPERTQDFGNASTKALRALIENRTVELEVVEQDRYDRLVARIWYGDLDVSGALIEQGYAWAYRTYLGQLPDDLSYCDLEAAARAGGRGLWVGQRADWVAPWQFREMQRRKRTRGSERGHVVLANFADETAARCRAAVGGGRQPDAAHLPPDPACPIKGNINSEGERIYHVPSSPAYATTAIDPSKGEQWFCTEQQARDRGWRPPKGYRNR